MTERQRIEHFLRNTRTKFQHLNRQLITLSSAGLGYIMGHPKLKWGLVIAVIPLLFFICLILFVVSQIPDHTSLKAFRNPVPSEVYTADSVLIGRFYIQDRRPVSYEEISPSVMEAVIATEDIRFYDHHGIDFRSLGRVLIKTILLQDESSGGGSTITQQLAKNIFPRREYWILSLAVNKLREALIASRLEGIYSKQEILTLYLNTVPFADNMYGIQAAAHRFFSRSAGQLSHEQAAVLVGMLKATHYYNPRLFPENSTARRNVVLAQMFKYGFLGKQAADSLQKVPLSLELGALKPDDAIAPYFKAHVKSQLEEWSKKTTKPDGSNYNLYADGLKIYTTLDSRLQLFAEKAVAKQMKELQQQFFNHWANEKPWGRNEDVVMDAVRRSRRYRALHDKGYSEEQIMAEMSKPVDNNVFTWDGSKQMMISPLDSIRHHIQYLNTGFLAMDPASGEVKAWVGGIDHDYFQYDHVKESTKRQVGSIFKPIVYARAIEEGVSPCEFISAGQKTYIDKEGEEWTPRNSNYDYPVQYSMRGALAYSVNTVSVKLINRAGVSNTIKLARSMGIRSELPDVPSIALGSSAISLMEMTAAYSCFVNEGITRYPFFIRAIEDREGNVFTEFQDRISGQRALSTETSLLVRQMLQTVVHEGTASRLRWKYNIYNDVAAKTGTTQENADGWFMAATPKLVMGTWVGADDPRIRFRDTRLGEGSNTALPVVAYFLRQINADPLYGDISKAKFPRLPREIRGKLDCDLYELDDQLWTQIEKSVHARDSIIQADTLEPPPPQTFLQSLYNRKRRIILISEEPSQNTHGTLVSENDRGMD